MAAATRNKSSFDLKKCSTVINGLSGIGMYNLRVNEQMPRHDTISMNDLVVVAQNKSMKVSPVTWFNWRTNYFSGWSLSSISTVEFLLWCTYWRITRIHPHVIHTNCFIFKIKNNFQIKIYFFLIFLRKERWMNHFNRNNFC